MSTKIEQGLESEVTPMQRKLKFLDSTLITSVNTIQKESVR